MNASTQPLPTTRGLCSGARTLDTDALMARARRAASGFHDLGVWQGDQVALLMRNDSAFFEATFGALLLGAAPVPLNWHLTADEIAYILDDCGAKVLVAHADLLNENVLAVCGGIEVIAVDTPAEIAAAYRIAPERTRTPGGIPGWDAWLDAWPEWLETPRALSAPMFYTSGTTGRPKGVKRKSAPPEVVAAIERRSSLAWGLDRKPLRAVMTGPMYHSAPNAYGLYVIRNDGLLVLQPRFDAEELLALVERHAITHLHMVPTMFVRLLALPEATRRRYDLSSLRFVAHGSAPCPPDVKRRMIDWWGPILHEYYAMTEIGFATASTSADWLSHPGSVGRALPGVTLKIVRDDRSECAPGETGEICVRSETTTRFTYHRAEDKTEAVRLGDFVATGDVGHLDADGFLYISDRKSDMVISGGVNVYPAEIEHVLIGLPNVRDCAVFGVPDPEFGERLVAAIEPSGPIVASDLRSLLRERLAAFKVPREIIVASPLPREDSGKIKKRLVRQAFLDGRLRATGD
jgi:long-chain acyl-CoA synthetase